MGGFSNFGLISQGQDAATTTQQGIAQREQEVRLKGQEIETGELGLEDVRRTHANQASYRNAVSTANPSDGVAGIYHNVSDAALRSGDFGTYDQARKASQALQDEGWGKIAVAALTGAPADQVEKQFNALGVSKMVPGSLEYGRDPKNGDIIASAINVQDGKRYPFNATQYAKLHGLIKNDTEKLGPNDKLVNKASGATLAENPISKWDVSRDSNIMWDERSGVYKNVGEGEWKLGHIVQGNKEIPVEINSKGGAIRQLGPGGARQGMEAKITQPTTPGGPVMISLPDGSVGEFRPATEATPGKTNWFSANEPGKPGEPSSITTIPVNQPEQPPVEGARKAADGKWYVRQGDGYAEVVPKAAQSPSGKPGPVTEAKPQKAKAMRPVELPQEVPSMAEPVMPPPPQDLQPLPAGQIKPGMRSVTAPPYPPEAPGLEAPQRVPIVSAGLETVNQAKRLFGSGKDDVREVLKRGEKYEAEDQALHSAGRLLRSLLASQGTVRNPSILRDAINDYQVRLERIEKIRQ